MVRRRPPSPAPRRPDTSRTRQSHGTPIIGTSRTRSINPTGDGNDALDTLRRFVQALRLSSSAAEREIGLPVAQLFVLRTLGRKEGLSLLELASETRTDPSSVSVVVKRLEERRLVARRRDPRDRRRIRLSLTGRGRALLAGAPQAPQDDLIAALAAMSAADRKRLVRLLERLTAAIGGTGRRPSMFFEEGRPRRR